MQSRLLATGCLLLLVCFSLLLGQSYRCDWQVVGIGGGELSGIYRCGATCGQTAAGYMNSPIYQAFIGYWQTDVQVGIKEELVWPNLGLLVTKLYVLAPNPFRSYLTIRYSLDAERHTVLQVHDLSGRVVRTLADGSQKAGIYTLRWDGRDDRGRLVGNGVYFCRMQSGGYTDAQKLILTR